MQQDLQLQLLPNAPVLVAKWDGQGSAYQLGCTKHMKALLKLLLTVSPISQASAPLRLQVHMHNSDNYI